MVLAIFAVALFLTNIPDLLIYKVCFAGTGGHAVLRLLREKIVPASIFLNRGL